MNQQSSESIMKASILKACKKSTLLSNLKVDEIDSILEVLVKEQFSDTRKSAQKSLEDIIDDISKRLVK
jgi:hypothetical protein